MWAKIALLLSAEVDAEALFFFWSPAHKCKAVEVRDMPSIMSCMQLARMDEHTCQALHPHHNHHNHHNRHNH